MKKTAKSSILIILLVTFFVQTSLACTCVEFSLKKRFRKAKAIFIGQVADKIPEDTTVQGKGVQTLEVVKSWKGVKKDFVSVNFSDDQPRPLGTCPFFEGFEEKKEYLVFAYEKDLRVETICSDTLEIPADEKDSHAHQQIKKLNSFWFRLWARISPF